MARLGRGLKRGGEIRELWLQEILALPASLSLSLSLSPNFRLSPGSGGLLARPVRLSQWKISVAFGLVVAVVSSRLSVLIRLVTEQPAACACL